MSMKSMLAVGVAAVFAIGAGAAQAQMKPQGGAAGSQSGTPGQMQSAPGQGTKASQADQTFLTEAMQGDLAEVQMGELAQQKGDRDDVKAFGETLEKDHGDHAKKLQSLAQQMGATLPNEPNAKQKVDHDRLSKLSGAQFDREFASHMVDDHKKTIAKYQAQAKKSGPLADLAKATVPVLQKHLQTAQSLNRPAPTTGAGGGAKR